MKVNQFFSSTALTLLLVLVTPVRAGEPIGSSDDLNFAQVTYVRADQQIDETWCFHTTVRHHDEGWDHFADTWQVLDDRDNEIGLRVLMHPHDSEQPFTRSECGIKIPNETKMVRVRAKCNVHGYGGHEVVLDLSMEEAEQYKITRTP